MSGPAQPTPPPPPPRGPSDPRWWSENKIDWQAYQDRVATPVATPWRLEGIDAMESCLFRSAFVVVGGGVMGAFLGTLFTSFDTTHDMDASKTNTQKVRESFRAMGKSSVHYAKQFAFIGGVYSLVECNLEKARGKTDMVNTVVTGCTTGGVLAARAGPLAAGLGCGGFAAFSVAIDYFTGRHK